MAIVDRVGHELRSGETSREIGVPETPAVVEDRPGCTQLSMKGALPPAAYTRLHPRWALEARFAVGRKGPFILGPGVSSVPGPFRPAGVVHAPATDSR